MKEVIQKAQERSVITTDEIDEKKFFGARFLTTTVAKKFIIQRHISGGKISYQLYDLDSFTRQESSKTYYYASLDLVIDYITSVGHQVYQFDSLSELARWMETN